MYITIKATTEQRRETTKTIYLLVLSIVDGGTAVFAGDDALAMVCAPRLINVA
jgi:hypothetical protein